MVYNLRNFINNKVKKVYMVKSLNNKHEVKIRKADGLISDYQACALNSIITILDKYDYLGKIDVDKVKNIFDYNEDGIHNMQYRYRKFNTYLSENKVPLKFNIKRYNSLQDIYRALHTQGAVPIFFWINVLHFTKDKYKNLDYQISFGDVFQNDNKHVLIFVGYDRKGEKILFIDPSYQIPWSKGNDDLCKHYFELDIKDFYQCTKDLKIFIEAKISKSNMKKYKKEKDYNKKQTKLK